VISQWGRPEPVGAQDLAVVSGFAAAFAPCGARHTAQCSAPSWSWARCWPARSASGIALNPVLATIAGLAAFATRWWS
jgi:hypothetical protein